jgi:nucleoside-diphosphate-sugar epimerase
MSPAPGDALGARQVLVTGMSGLIGQAVRRGLQGRHALSALNRSRLEGVPCHRADIADLAAIQPAFEGVDAVVHLAAYAHSTGTWEEIHHHNILGTYNVFEAARRAGVRRVVYASSGATVSGCEADVPYSALVAGRYGEVPAPWPMLTPASPPRPHGLYGVSKLFGEALGRQYADAHGLSVICLRIGAVTAEDRPTHLRHFAVWCSQRDIVQAVERALEAPDTLRFEVCFVNSDNRWGYRDLSHTRRVLGWEPQDRAEDHRSG